MEAPRVPRNPSEILAYRPPFVTDPFARPRYPSVITRIAIGVLIFLGVFVAIVLLPAYVVGILNSNGVPVSFSDGDLVYVGALLAALSAAYYAVRPTVAYGPVGIATDVAELAYLYVLYLASPLRLSLSDLGGGTNGVITVGVVVILLVLAIAALFNLAGNVTTTLHDIRRPGERLWWTYPVR
ncbi:MAG: hypothetical protein ACREB9_08910 [Thermoplasmata archaeon]